MIEYRGRTGRRANAPIDLETEGVAIMGKICCWLAKPELLDNPKAAIKVAVSTA